MKHTRTAEVITRTPLQVDPPARCPTCGSYTQDRVSVRFGADDEAKVRRQLELSGPLLSLELRTAFVEQSEIIRIYVARIGGGA